MELLKSFTKKFSITTEELPVNKRGICEKVIESEVLKRGLPNLTRMSKDELSAYIKLFYTDHMTFAASTKARIAELERKIEEGNVFGGKFQEQIKQLVNENDILVENNNELKLRQDELEKEVDQNQKRIQELEEDTKEGDSIIDEMETEIKEDKETIQTLNKKMLQLVADKELANCALKKSEERVVSLTAQFERQQREIDSFRKEFEATSLDKANELTQFMEERIEFKKAASMYEKSLTLLSSEKASLERKLSRELERRTPKVVHEQIQTEEAFESFEISSESSKIISLNQKLEKAVNELNSLRIERHSAALENQKLEFQLEKLKKRVSELGSQLEFQKKEETKHQSEINTLKEENKELRKRRESAAAEIRRLSVSSGKSSSATKVNRYASEAAIQQSNNKMSREKELILSTRKDLDALYKELIRSIFSCTEDKILQAGGKIEGMLTQILERLADFCDDMVAIPAKVMIVKLGIANSHKKDDQMYLGSKLNQSFNVSLSYKRGYYVKGLRFFILRGGLYYGSPKFFLIKTSIDSSDMLK